MNQYVALDSAALQGLAWVFISSCTASAVIAIWLVAIGRWIARQGDDPIPTPKFIIRWHAKQVERVAEREGVLEEYAAFMRSHGLCPRRQEAHFRARKQFRQPS